ncbi:hypothetical protein LUZ61_002178 [Rhynchospora tenuis]|uniref:DNA ligase n=1 Tax=Rhynchospora tenuis TaxID=198213 RepID=A0AAD6ERF4_9POAL|nr:hypothetical protein LUZ61_002178 [Rhynchospora tenuis]
MTDQTVRFGLLVSMFQAMLRERSAPKKRRFFRKFLDRVYTGREYFSAVRLILPSLDRERGTYGLKEAALAQCLVDALGLAKDSLDAVRLLNWRKAGSRAGQNAGNFAMIAAEVLQSRQGMSSGGLTIKELNDALDRLATTENRSEKATVLAGLIKKTNALEMKWILMIILKDLKLGISEKSIFHEFHLDAEDLFNVTCDLKLVCEKLKDRGQRHKRQDIEVGKAVRAQLAMRVSDASAAWKKLHGKQVVAECKFDGDRIQIHKNGDEIHFFSRNFIDHPEYAPGMSKLIKENILVDRCILDGEMLVWDKTANRFADFGSNQEIAKAAREGFESDRQLCYVAFDVLYAGDTSVIHQTLAERHEILRKIIKPIKGQFELLLPNMGLNENRQPGEPCWSIIASSQEDVEKFFKETIENRDEGIVVKDLGSKWEPGDRSGKWLKLKPDYIHAGSDLDVLIIGGYFGSGRHGGEVAQFLVGLAERSDPDTYPKRFLSFCRVGTGLSDEELNTLVNKLKPYFMKNEYPKRTPRFYEVTNNSKERPDVWIESPDKSILVSITSDIRTIKSEVFAAPYSLRFPRIHCVRYDKPWHECLDVQEFVKIVRSSNGTTNKATNEPTDNFQTKRAKPTKKSAATTLSIVPSHLIKTDVSSLKEETLIFANMIFYFANIPPIYNLEYFHKLVAENGGTFAMNINPSVTHCIASEKKGIKYQAAVRQGDVIHYSWILDSCKEKRLLHLQPKYILFLSDSSKYKLREEIDHFSDYYFWDIDIADLKQIFGNMSDLKSPIKLQYYKKKHCAEEKFCFFQGCRIYVYKPTPLRNHDYNVISDLALKRLVLELTMHGGEVCTSLTLATHVVAYSLVESYNFDSIYNSVPPSERQLLHYKRVKVVNHKWLEDSVATQRRLPEDSYNLKPVTFEEVAVEEREEEQKPPIDTSDHNDQGAPVTLNTSTKRKRGRPEGLSLRKTKRAPKPAPRRTRGRTGTRRAKIDQEKYDSAESKSEEESESELKPSKDQEPTVAAQFVKFDGEAMDLGTKKANSLNDEILEGELFDKPHDEEIEENVNEGVDKLEQMVDPIHAMLLDMIPSLSQKKEETGTSSGNETKKAETQKVPAQPGSSMSTPKKKVSYKDAAAQLLKDW